MIFESGTVDTVVQGPCNEWNRNRDQINQSIRHFQILDLQVCPTPYLGPRDPPVFEAAST